MQILEVDFDVLPVPRQFLHLFCSCCFTLFISTTINAEITPTAPPENGRPSLLLQPVQHLPRFQHLHRFHLQCECFLLLCNLMILRHPLHRCCLHHRSSLLHPMKLCHNLPSKVINSVFVSRRRHEKGLNTVSVICAGE